MKFIDTKTHGVLDYLVGFLLIASPWVLNFYRDGAETWVPVTLGVAALLYSLFTNYELGINKLIPMRTHLMFDLLSGILLAASPWIFGFADGVYVPHLVLGLFEIAASVCTKTTTQTQGAHNRSSNTMMPG